MCNHMIRRVTLAAILAACFSIAAFGEINSPVISTAGEIAQEQERRETAEEVIARLVEAKNIGALAAYAQGLVNLARDYKSLASDQERALVAMREQTDEIRKAAEELRQKMQLLSADISAEREANRELIRVVSGLQKRGWRQMAGTIGTGTTAGAAVGGKVGWAAAGGALGLVLELVIK